VTKRDKSDSPSLFSFCSQFAVICRKLYDTSMTRATARGYSRPLQPLSGTSTDIAFFVQVDYFRLDRDPLAIVLTACADSVNLAIGLEEHGMPSGTLQQTPYGLTIETLLQVTDCAPRGLSR
jgi:hypothetical protein